MSSDEIMCWQMGSFKKIHQEIKLLENNMDKKVKQYLVINGGKFKTKSSSNQPASDQARKQEALTS